MPASPDTVKLLQQKIDAHRENGVTIEVDHSGVYDGEPETTLAIAFSDEYNAFDVGRELQEIIGLCDSGAGCGFRDLQLCSHWPGLK